MATHFTADPELANTVFEPGLIYYPWSSRVKLASASDVLGYGTKPELERVIEMWLSKGQGVPGHPLAVHNAVLEQRRNRDVVMAPMTGDGGYQTWMKGVGPEKTGRGLYLATEIIFHKVPALCGIFTVKDRLDGFFAIRDNLVGRYVCDVYDGDELAQTVTIMCFVKGTAPEGLAKPPKSNLVMPEGDPDFVAIHQLRGKNLIFEWGCAAGDPNIRHDDAEDPRAHGPCAISILTHDVMRFYTDHAVEPLRRINVPGISNPFYEDDVVVSKMWRVSDAKVVGQLERPLEPDPKKRVVLSQIEYDLAA